MDGRSRWAGRSSCSSSSRRRRPGHEVSTGNIYGKVVDDSQAVLPGATATLTGPLGTRTTTADTQGEFRFLNIDHGTHKLVVTLSGVRRRQP